jgi:hypothetical protein
MILCKRKTDVNKGTGRCYNAVTCGLLLSGQKCSGAKTQSKITYDPCDMLEIMDNPPTAVKCQQLPGQIPLGFQTCAIPKAGPATAPDSWRTQDNACGCGEVGSHVAGRVGCSAGLSATPMRVHKFPEKACCKKGMPHKLPRVFSAAKWHFCVAYGFKSLFL